MPEITLQDGRTMDMQTWFRNIFIDARSFDYREIKESVMIMATPREMTLSTINTIIETIKLNGYKIDSSKMQFRAKTNTSFVFYLLLEKDL